MTRRKQGGVQVQLRCLYCGRGPIKGTKYPYGDAYERVYSGGLKKHLLSQKGTCYQHYEKLDLVGWSASSENAVDFRSSVVGYWADAIKVTKKATYMPPPSESPMMEGSSTAGASTTTTRLYNENACLGAGSNWMGGATNRTKRQRSLRESREQYESSDSDRGQKRKAMDCTDNEASSAKRSSSSIASRSTIRDKTIDVESEPAGDRDIPRAIKVEQDSATHVSPEQQQQQQQLEEPSTPPPPPRRSLELAPPPPHVERRGKDETALEQTVNHLQEQMRAQKEWFEALFQNQAKEVAALATKVRDLEDAAMKQATNRRKMASAFQEATLALLKE